MEALDSVVREALDEISPPRLAARSWESVVAADVQVQRALLRRRWRSRRFVAALATPALLAAVALALILAWPFGGRSNLSLLDRAAAAIGDGPVLHVTIESGFGATAINLGTGTRSFVHGEEEMWFDPQRGIRDLTKFRGVVQGDAIYPPGLVKHLDTTLSFLAVGYRDALKNGTARVIGDDTVDGEAVSWVRVDTQKLPDTSDGKLHEWAHDVAVSKKTFKPVATRETRDGAVGPDGISRIRAIETLSEGHGDFSPPKPSLIAGQPMSFTRTGSLSPSEATDVLGRKPLTPGAEVDGLRLGRIAKEVRREGLDRKSGQWKTTHEGVVLFYGSASGGGIGQPRPAGNYLQISETTAPDAQFVRGVENYFPPPNELLVFGGSYGLMQQDGIYISLEGSSESLLVQGAQALTK